MIGTPLNKSEMRQVLWSLWMLFVVLSYSELKYNDAIG